MLWRRKPKAPAAKLPVRRLVEDAKLPTRAHAADAGYDLYSCEDTVIEPGGQVIIHTGVAIAIPQGFGGLVLPRSSMNKKGIMSAVGLVDAGYTGEVRVKLTNTSRSLYRVRQGDRIAQLTVVPVFLGEVEETLFGLPASARGTGGFGSTGS
jgi:dUTP pyrophosphatase